MCWQGERTTVEKRSAIFRQCHSFGEKDGRPMRVRHTKRWQRQITREWTNKRRTEIDFERVNVAWHNGCRAKTGGAGECVCVRGGRGAMIYKWAGRKDRWEIVKNKKREETKRQRDSPMTPNLFLSFSLSSLPLFPPFLPINHFDFCLTNSFPADGRQTATIPALQPSPSSCSLAFSHSWGKKTKKSKTIMTITKATCLKASWHRCSCRLINIT